MSKNSVLRTARSRKCPTFAILRASRSRLVYEQRIDVAAEREKLKKELEKIEKELAKIDRQLGNESFTTKLPRMW